MFSKKSQSPFPYTLDQWKEVLSTVRKTTTGKESKAKYNCSEVVSQLIKGSTTGVFTRANTNPHLNRRALILAPSFITREPDYSSLPSIPASSSSSTMTELSYVTLGNSYLSYSTTSSDSINNQIIPITDSYTYKDSSGKLVSVHEFKGDVEKNLTQHVEFDVSYVTERLQELALAEKSEFILVVLTLTPIEIIDPTEKNKKKAEIDAVSRLNTHTNGGHVILAQYVTANFHSSYGIPRLIVIDPAGYVGTNIQTMFPFVNIDQPEPLQHDLFDRNIGCMLVNTEARIKINTCSLPTIKKENCTETKTPNINPNISSKGSQITQTLPSSKKRKLPAFITNNLRVIIPSQCSQSSHLPTLPEKKRTKNKSSSILDRKLPLKETTIAPETVLFDMLNNSDFSQRYRESFKLLIKQSERSGSGKIKKISKHFKFNTRRLYAELGHCDFREVLNNEDYTLSQSSLAKLMNYHTKAARFFLAVLMASAFYNKNKNQIAPYLSKYKSSPQVVRKNVLTKNVFTMKVYQTLMKDQKLIHPELVNTDLVGRPVPPSVSENFGKIFFSDSFKSQYNKHRDKLSIERKTKNYYSDVYVKNIALLYNVLRCPYDILIALETNILTVDDFKFLIEKPLGACRFVIACLLASNTLPQNVLLLEKMSALVKQTDMLKKSLDSNLPEVITPPARTPLNDPEVKLQKDSQQINRYLPHHLPKINVEQPSHWTPNLFPSRAASPLEEYKLKMSALIKVKLDLQKEKLDLQQDRLDLQAQVQCLRARSRGD